MLVSLFHEMPKIPKLICFNGSVLCDGFDFQVFTWYKRRSTTDSEANPLVPIKSKAGKLKTRDATGTLRLA